MQFLKIKNKNNCIYSSYNATISDYTPYDFAKLKLECLNVTLQKSLKELPNCYNMSPL